MVRRYLNHNSHSRNALGRYLIIKPGICENQNVICCLSSFSYIQLMDSCAHKDKQKINFTYANYLELKFQALHSTHKEHLET